MTRVSASAGVRSGQRVQAGQTATRTSSGPVYVGFDVGSVACKAAVLDKSGDVLDYYYQRSSGQPAKVMLAALQQILGKYAANGIGGISGTGSAGRFICELMRVPFVNELLCQARAVRTLVPEARTIIEMGGQDSKLIFLGQDKDDPSAIEEFTMNTACAAGTGSFLDQQASRLGINIEDEFGRLALASKNPPRVAGRCSVFAKSDMIHLQQQATPVHDIVAGLCFGLARNLKSNLGKGKQFLRPIVFCGGVAANMGVVRALKEVLEATEEGQFIVPQLHAVTGAIGAALIGMADWDGNSQVQIDLQSLKKYLAAKRTIGHRLAKLKRPQDGYPQMKTWADEVFAALKPGEKLPAYLGVDVGSISTNVAVIDDEHRVLAKAYLMTAGRPLEAVRKGLSMVAPVVADKVEIKAAATTGSGRYLTGDFIGADIVVNEITAQATGAAMYDKTVDTIFEIGGQDSKYISLENGVVVDFEMNHACAAGTGSFLEEQAERLGIDIKTQFNDLALNAESPIRLGERCTVFMESDLLSYQQQGARTDNLVAGLCYSIVTNYLNRVVGQRKVGRRIFFQGGTAFNKGVVAAFEAITGKRVTVPPHHEVTGAIGVAALAKRYMDQQPAGTKSTFRGFDLGGRKYKIRSFECNKCPNNCEINEVTIEGSQPLYYGSRCDLYNVKKDQKKFDHIPDLFTERQKLLESYGRVRRKARGDRPTVGIPMMLSNYQLLPFWGTLFDELGADPIISSRSTKALIRKGVEAVLSQPCFPVKVAHGHVLDLMDKKVDYLWLPSIVSMPRDGQGEEAQINNQLCPYVQTIPYQVQAAIDPEAAGVKLLKLPVRFQDGWKHLVKSLLPLCGILGVTRRKLTRALQRAHEAQESFEAACRKRGREILDSLQAHQRAMVLVSRPYNGCDPGVSLDIPGKLRKLGVLTIPMDFLELTGSPLPRFQNRDGMYWKYGQRIIKACKKIHDDPRLYAIYLSNFSCGPDSFIATFFKDLMGNKPCLMLEIDEHSADAGVVTRLEAFLESLRHARTDAIEPLDEASLKVPRVDCSRRRIYIPWMGDHSYALAAAFRACGQPAEVLPLADEEALDWGRRYTSGKECLPCIITTGDMLKRIQTPGFEPEKSAFFMPGGSGPCRFGQYSCLHRLILHEVGHGDIPVISPSQDKTFYDDFKQFRKDPTRLAWNGIVAVDILYKVLFALRPFEVNRGEVERVYQQHLSAICQAVEARCSEPELVDLMVRAAGDFARIKLDRTRDKPHIGVVGEIYVRSHVFSNNHLIRRLEELGAAVSLASFAEWMYYTNFTRKRTSKREQRYRSYLVNLYKDRLQKKIERRLAEPFVDLVPHVIEPPVEDVLELADPYIHHSFEGEAALSVGKTVEYNHLGADGVVNVGPFTCMPSTIVSSVMKRVTADLGGMPAITIMYDGQQDPTLETRLEAFVHQARMYRQRRLRISKAAAVAK